MSHPLTVRIPDELNEGLEAAAREGRTSKSELVREYLSESVIESEVSIPAHIRTKVRREQLKSRNELRWQRVHFPSNVHERFKRAFEQGDLDGDLGEKAIEDLREIHVEDAKLLFEDDPERREGAVEFVKAVAEKAKEATEASEFNKLDTSEMFEHHAGVQVGTQREGTDLVAVVDDVCDRMEQTGATDEDALTTVVAKNHGISESLARECVDYALGRTDSIEGVSL